MLRCPFDAPPPAAASQLPADPELRPKTPRRDEDDDDGQRRGRRARRDGGDGVDQLLRRAKDALSNADVPFLPQLPYTNHEVLHDTMTECYGLVPGVYSTVDELACAGGRSTRSTTTTSRSTTLPTTRPAAIDVPCFTFWRPGITRRAWGSRRSSARDGRSSEQIPNRDAVRPRGDGPEVARAVLRVDGAAGQGRARGGTRALGDDDAGIEARQENPPNRGSSRGAIDTT